MDKGPVGAHRESRLDSQPQGPRDQVWNFAKISADFNPSQSQFSESPRQEAAGETHFLGFMPPTPLQQRCSKEPAINPRKTDVS